MEQTRQLQSYALIDKHELDLSELPEKIRNKFQMLDELLENYEESSSENEAKGIAAQIEACDTGLSSDLESYIAEKDNSSNEDEGGKTGNNDSQADDNKDKKDNDPTPTQEKPTWRWWM